MRHPHVRTSARIDRLEPRRLLSAATTLAEFDGTDGSSPTGGLYADAAGDLFGVAVGGTGTLWELPANASQPRRHGGAEVRQRRG